LERENVMTQDFFSTLNDVKKVLAADFACEESDFDNAGVFVHQAKELPGRRDFPFRKNAFAAATMGRGVVIFCSLERLGWADANLSRLTRNDMFTQPTIALIDGYVKQAGQYMAGPDLKHVCTKSIFQPYKPAGGLEINLVEDVLSLGLYGDKRFPNSLGHGAYPKTPFMVAAVVKCGGQIAGIAAAWADCDVMWQIGVDTLPEYRRRGIGKAAVSAVTEYLLEHGVIPYYSTLESNTASRATAAALGYKPAWVELNARELKAEGGH
jgi:GNAT superfamily N-acetyltransferase